MRVTESSSSVFSYFVPKELSVRSVAAIALPIIAGLGLIYLAVWFFRAQPPQAPVNLTDLFNRVVSLSNPSRPKLLLTTQVYRDLIARRTELGSNEQNQLFHAELSGVCDSKGELDDGFTQEYMEEFVRTFVQPPQGDWSQETLTLYHSIMNGHAARKFAIHYNHQNQLDSVRVAGQKLPIQVIPGDGDCLFSSVIAGITWGNPPTAIQLRQQASEQLLQQIDMPDEDPLLIQQCAEGMRMHEEARGGESIEQLILQSIEMVGLDVVKQQVDPSFRECSTKEEFMRQWRNLHANQVDERDPKELAREYCRALATPKEIYPGVETIKIVAEILRQQIVLVYENSIESYGPRDPEILPIMIYKMPGVAHFNRLIITLEEWNKIKAGREDL